MQSIRLPDAQARLPEIVEDVHRSQQRIEITRGGRPSVVLISAEDLDSMEATLELASDAAAMERVSRA